MPGQAHEPPTERCPDCERRFSILRWRRGCRICKGVRCRSCLIEAALPRWAGPLPAGTICRPCHAEKIAPLVARYQRALTSRIDVIAYLGNYQGEQPADPQSRLPIESGFHSQKNAALMELQTICTFHGRNAIEELCFIEESVTHSVARPGEGPVPFGESERSMWKAAGTAVTLPLPKTGG